MQFRHLAPGLFGLLALSGLALVVACSSTTNGSDAKGDDDSADDDDDSTGDDDDDDSTGDDDAPIVKPKADAAPTDPFEGCTKDPGAPTVTVDPNSATDPAGSASAFTIAKAMAGFSGTGKLVAVITTELGAIRCELDEAAAPISVANFVGLSRGTRPFKKDGKWTVGRFYDGLVWHRVIPDFVIQGGDPLGKGTGGPGYDLVEENHIFEDFGALAMAASAVPSGSQFYVVVGTGPEANYNVFGKCSTAVAVAISAVEVDAKDKPTTPVHMTSIDIARCP